jgi:hypothetical protein
MRDDREQEQEEEEEEELEEEDAVENEEEKKTVPFLGPIPPSLSEPTVTVTIIFNGCSTPFVGNRGE